MSLTRFRNSVGRRRERGLRLWPIGIVLAATFVFALATATAVFTTGWKLLGVQGLKPEHRLTSQTLFDLVKLAFGVVAGAGGLIALVVAYRRQRIDEDGAKREATRLHTERFTTAVTQLGDASPAVCLGGVHALAGLADDAPTTGLRQTCIDVLCAYLRLPYTAETDLPDNTAALHNHLALRQVRHTVIRLIRDHLRLDADHPHTWQGRDFDLTGAVFDGGDLSKAIFSDGTVNFTDAHFVGPFSFHDAHFLGGTVNFTEAHFRGGTVDFTEAHFFGGTVNYTKAIFDGSTVNFTSAHFAAGTVNYTRAIFQDGTVDYTKAIFDGSTVNFTEAHFLGGTVNYTRASFQDGTVDYTKAIFEGSTVNFIEVPFTRITVKFASAHFAAGTVNFTHAGFGACAVGFRYAHFSGGTVIFARAGFIARVDFRDVHFTGSTVDFRGDGPEGAAMGTAPDGLVPINGQPLPLGLLLPSEWSSPTS
ncbi:pentapeptide repeat-containing protein [Streptomyces odontomachi]|uniref:pentapeptide repeat-containing protein n=1 Tax=Streptomyces odontomachi TaxID=2944940 RepID=UPI0021090D06|nr:pentapeptide repeat-containing protein [Streptomyces sp. ODS25]